MSEAAGRWQGVVCRRLWDEGAPWSDFAPGAPPKPPHHPENVPGGSGGVGPTRMTSPCPMSLWGARCLPWSAVACPSLGSQGLDAPSPGTHALHDSGSRLAVRGRGLFLQHWDKVRHGPSLREASMDQMTPAEAAGPQLVREPECQVTRRSRGHENMTRIPRAGGLGRPGRLPGA